MNIPLPAGVSANSPDTWPRAVRVAMADLIALWQGTKKLSEVKEQLDFFRIICMDEQEAYLEGTETPLIIRINWKHSSIVVFGEDGVTRYLHLDIDELGLPRTAWEAEG